MRKRTFVTFQALILAILGFYLLDKLGADEIQFYINPRFIFLTVLTALAIFIMAQRTLSSRMPAVEIPSPDVKGVSRWKVTGLFLLLLPIVFDLILQGLPYQAKELQVSGVNLAIPAAPALNTANNGSNARSSDRSILDWVLLYQNNQGTDRFAGQKADVTGFVNRRPGQEPGTFLLVRYVISNSAADLQPVGMEVIWPQSADLMSGLWVRVQGSMAPFNPGSVILPRLTAQSVVPSPDPEMPYLIP